MISNFSSEITSSFIFTAFPFISLLISLFEFSNLDNNLRQEICDYTIKIPTKFCINVQIAGSIVMYDRIRSLGKFAQRPQTEVEQKDD